MNIIRTAAVELTSIPAIAYKQKLSAGGSGVKIHRLDTDAVAVITIDRRSGEGTPYGKLDAALFPQSAIDEAIESTLGLPYSARGKIKITAYVDTAAEAEDVTEAEPEKTDMVESVEYQSIINYYTDIKGRIDYQRMNKDFIQFAEKSKIVTDLIDKKAPIEDMLVHIVRDRAGFLSGSKKSLSDSEVKALIETIDEINPRSAYKELSAHLKRKLAGAK